MKKKLMAVLLSAFLVSLNVSYSSAATCPPHGPTTTITYAAGNHTSIHYIWTGEIVGGTYEYDTCWANTEYIQHDMYCTSCNTMLNRSYSERTTHTYWKCK